MKVVAYSIKTFEKELLAKANQKKHDITLISNPLSPETALYAEGKDAVVVFTNDDVSAPVINLLADMGIKYIATRSADTGHIDKVAAGNRGIKLANVPKTSDAVTVYINGVGSNDIATLTSNDALQQIADKTIRNLDLWQQDKCVGDACACAKSCRATTISNTPIIKL